jgi:hypothetical protein
MQYIDNRSNKQKTTFSSKRKTNTRTQVTGIHLNSKLGQTGGPKHNHDIVNKNESQH